MTNDGKTEATSVALKGGEKQEKWIALLGRRDEPIDGVEDYCTFLEEALAKRGVGLERVHVPWADVGMRRALRNLSRAGSEWRNRWVLIQYTALAWSRRGFPFPALAVAARLKRLGAKVAVTFHEQSRQGDSWPRPIDKIRGACQDWVVTRLYQTARKSIFADPLDRIAWLPKGDTKSVFIPIGANVPGRISLPALPNQLNGARKRVVIFCLTEPPKRHVEVADIAHAVRAAVTTGLAITVQFCGRGTDEAREEITQAFQDLPVEVSAIGLRSASEISDILAHSDAMLCVRGKLNLRRGSAIAGIACGLPIIGYAGGAEGTPLMEAGVLLVSQGDRVALGAALTRVLGNSELRRTLRERSLRAQQLYFSWDAIAQTFIRALQTS